MYPLRHCPCVILRHWATADEDAQQPLAHMHLREGVGVEPGITASGCNTSGMGVA
jgi:hypothetical protein